MTRGALLLAAVLLSFPALALAHGGSRGGGAAGHGPLFPAAADLARQIADFDTDGDGRITRAELHSGLRARAAAADADGDGTLDAAEFGGLLRAERRARLERLLSRHDGDGDGRVSTAELARVPDWFGRVDGNGDGAVDADELARLQRHCRRGRCAGAGHAR